MRNVLKRNGTRGWCDRKSASRAAIVVLCFLCICFQIGFPRQTVAAGTRLLTLDQALQIARENNKDIRKAHEYGHSVQGRYVEERSAALPQLTLTGSASVARDESQQLFFGTAAEQYSRVVDLSLSQPLYTWGKVSAAIRAAEEGLKTADEQLRLARQGTERDVAVAFYNLLLAKELHRFALENLEQKKRHSDEAHKKFAAGVATDYDVLAADVSVQNARPETIRTENLIKTNRDQLSFLLGIEGEAVDAVGTLDMAVTPPPVFDETLQTARDNRPELADRRHRLGIYSELVTIAAAENKPRLDLKGGVGWHQLDVASLGNDGAAWTVGVYLSFPFFDGFKTEGRVQQARSDLATKRIEEQKLLDAISLEVRNAINSVREAGEIVTALSGTVRQADRLLQMAEKGYEYGVKIRLEVDDAQLNLLQAQSNLARAKRDYLAARTNLDWTTGRLGE